MVFKEFNRNHWTTETVCVHKSEVYSHSSGSVIGIVSADGRLSLSFRDFSRTSFLLMFGISKRSSIPEVNIRLHGSFLLQLHLELLRKTGQLSKRQMQL